MPIAQRLCLATLVIAAPLVAPDPGLHAAGTEPKPSSEGAARELYDQGFELVKQGDFAAARETFEKALAQDAKDPDVLNMLAFTQRKTGDLQGAFATYEQALANRSRFPQAREYLAEAHLQAVMDQAALLKSYGDEGADHLATIAEELRRALAEVAAMVPPTAKPAGKW